MEKFINFAIVNLRLSHLNIEADYPSHKERLLNSLNEERCKIIINETYKLQTWIKSKL